MRFYPDLTITEVPMNQTLYLFVIFTCCEKIVEKLFKENKTRGGVIPRHLRYAVL